jgi:hypothetical protein
MRDLLHMDSVDEHLEVTDYAQLFESGLGNHDRVQILQPGGVLVYVHLPKAAGNSSIGALRGHFTPYVSVNWRKPREHAEEIVANWNEKPVHFISGHLSHTALEVIRRSSLPHICVTFLRHPVERLISVYRYSSSAKAPNQDVFLATYPSLEHYVYEAVRTNEISRFMLGRNVRSLAEYKEGMKKFAFIGVSELLPVCHLVLSRMLKCSFTYPGRANVTNNPEVGIDVPQRLLDYLYTTQQIDIMFHSYILERYCELATGLMRDAELVPEPVRV